MTRKTRGCCACLTALALTTLACFLALPASFAQVSVQRLDEEIQFEIPAQPLATALVQFSKQARIQLVTSSVDLGAQQTQGVSGLLSIGRALDALLDRTGLAHSLVGENTVAITPPTNVRANATSALSGEQAPPVAGADTPGRAKRAVDRETDLDEMRVTIPEVLVVGSKILNMDIRRTRDDPQPYVIFERATIEQSGAQNIESFLKQRLTMNTTAETASQVNALQGPVSQINLRGLGQNQTLILIDGHRTAGASFQGQPQQPDLNGIPLSAVERIEVLPTTASGIYGGSATGGVINVVLRRDYTGAEVKVGYENTFASDAATRRIDLGAGFTLGSGDTNILVAASYRDQNVLTVRERSLVQRGISAIQANNPDFFLSSTSPPLGATTNIRSANGADLTLRDGGTSLNSPITHVPAGYPGAASDGGAALLANAGTYNLDVANSAQRRAGGASLLNSPTVESIATTVRRRFTPSIEGFVEVAAANNTGHIRNSNLSGTYVIPAQASTNPFNEAIRVSVPSDQLDTEVVSRSFTRRVVGGVIVKLPEGWQAGADYIWSSARLASPATPTTNSQEAAAINNGTLNVLRDTRAFPIDLSTFRNMDGNYFGPFNSSMDAVTLRAAGSVGSLPAGPLQLSAMLEYRTEELDGGSRGLVSGGSNFTQFSPSRSQTVFSSYVEGRLPLLSKTNRIAGVELLELQLAVRRDDYAVDGVTGTITTGPGLTPGPIARSKLRNQATNPTIALRYVALPDLTLRASYGTGFLPPNVNQVLTLGPFDNRTGGIDPRRGGTPAGPYQEITGGNSDLRPEKSKSWSGGLIFTPRLVPGLRLSVDYTAIEKTDNIVPLTVQQVIDHESLFPDRVRRGPADPGDPFAAGPIVFLDTSLANIASAEIEAYDVQLDYSVAATESIGTFEAFAVATWQTHYQTQLLPSLPVVENVGVSNASPLRFKANFGLNWRYRDWSLGWATSYFDSYLVADPRLASAPALIRNQGSMEVSSQIYHDLFGSYRFGQRGSDLLSGLEIQFGIKNVFDREPPFDASATFFYSPFADPRLSTYYLSLTKTF